MCEQGQELLESWILELLRERSPRPSHDVLSRLQRHGACQDHFVEALRGLITKGHLQAGDPSQPTAPQAGTVNLLDLALRAVDKNDSAALGETSRLLSGRFTIFLDQKLGRGGSGRVYRGVQISLNRPVAIKLLSLRAPAGGETAGVVIERFKREPRLLAALSHPHLVQVIDSGQDGSEFWSAMELLEGGTLKDRIETEGRLQPGAILESMIAVAEALGAAAAAGILHRDVKPENIFNAGTKLGDFGVGKMVMDEAGLTRDLASIGTILYMAPERAGFKPGDLRSDIYSLGATFYHAAAGRLLFDVSPQDRREWRRRQAEEDPVPLAQRVREFPPALADIIHRCLHKAPEDRYPTYEALLADLRRIGAEPASVPSGRPLTRLASPEAAPETETDSEVPSSVSFPAWSDSGTSEAVSPKSIAGQFEAALQEVAEGQRRPVPSDPLTAPSTRMVRPPEVEEAARNPKSVFSHFVLLKEVGKGGMGTVYRAWDNSVGRVVALKVLRDTSGEAVERFVLEARIAGRLNHPSIALVYEVGEHEGRFYIAMQFIDGKPLGSRPIHIRRMLELIRDAARTLQYAHDQGVIHRDVKPANLLLDSQGKIFLTDFGLAKEVTGVLGSQLSVTGTLMGTPTYMSPEQAQPGSRKLDARSDVYSLGATLYVLLTGRPPFEDLEVLDLLLAIAKRRAPPLRPLNTAISPELEAAVLRALEKDPDRRYPTAGAFAEEIDRLIREERYVGKYGLAKYLFRRWWPRAAAGVALAAAIRFGAPHLVSSSTPAATSEDRAALYTAASGSLQSIEKDLASLAPADLHARLSREVTGRLDKILESNPRHLPARVERIRAAYVEGRAGLDRELAAIAEDHRRDYRIPFLRALLVLENFLGQPPLPALEAPVSDWEGQPEPMPAGVLADLREAAAASAEPILAEERRRDLSALKALIPLAESRWEEAAVALAEVMKTQPLPVYARAWVRAAYLSGRRFDEVRASLAARGRREALGAGMALAARSPKDLETLLAECGEDRQAAVLLHAALAWQALDVGRDPEPHVSAGLENAVSEMKGVLLAARLRRLALVGKDDEPLYREAMELLGESPSSWMGRRAALEARLGLGSRLARRGGDARAPLEDVIRRANAMTDLARSWNVPRILRASALLRQDNPIVAFAEIAPLADGPAADAPARIVAAAAWLRFTEQRRKDGAPSEKEAEQSLDRCLKYVRQALADAHDHPEALNLAAAAELSRVEMEWAKEAEASALLEEAIKKLNRAIALVPGFVDARVHRAAALYLKSESASNAELRASSLADLDAALAAVPELAPARYLRGIIRFSLGRFAPAAEDWKLLIREGSPWDTPDLRRWIAKAEARGERR